MLTKNFIIRTPIGSPSKIYCDDVRGKSPITRSRLKSISRSPTPTKSRSGMMTPVRAGAKSNMSSRTPSRRYKNLIVDHTTNKFTLLEDYMIMKEYNQGKNNSVRQTASNLRETLKRENEVIERRIRTIISKLNASDVSRVANSAKVLIRNLMLEIPTFLCPVR